MTENRNIVLSRRESASMLGLSIATFDRIVRAGDLPRGIQLSPRRVGWQMSVLLDWIAKKQAQADKAQAA